MLRAPVVVLTNVGLEHTRWLGPTIADIAREKLAVVAPGATLVLGRADPEASAELRRSTPRRRRRIVRPAPPDVRGGFAGYQRDELRGRAARRREPSRPRSTRRAVARVAARITVPGRFQVVGEAPLTILDGAHNPSGVAALAAALPDAGDRPLVGSSRSSTTRTPAGMLRALRPLAAGAVFTAARNPRALPPATLASLAEPARRPPAEIVPDPRAALARARELAGPEGAVIGHRLDLPGRRPALRAGRRRASAL